MKVLLIEDRPETREFIVENLQRAIPSVEIAEAADAETGERLFFGDDFDLTLLDLEILATEDDQSPHISHGERLLEVFRTRRPGAPLCVLTSHGTMEHANSAFTVTATPDVFGDTRVPTLCFITKDNIRRAILHASSIAGVLARFDAIDLRVEPRGAAGELELRILQRYAVFFGATRLVAKRFGSGLSGAKAFSVKMFDANGTPQALLAIKINSLEKSRDEIHRYDQYVAPLLSPNALAPLVASPMIFGPKAGVAYRLLDSREFTLFQLVAVDVGAAVRAVSEVEKIEAGWFRNVAPRDVLLADVRRTLVADSELTAEQAKIVNRYSSLEKRAMRMRGDVQHGDLHGENILCSDEGDATLIDYADVGKLLPPAYSVMLELSFVFHPSSKALSLDWPRMDNLRRWMDIESFVSNCPFAQVIRQCRAWSSRVMEPVGDDGLIASAYSYLVWQLKFAPHRFQDVEAILSSIEQRL